ncbi:MAG TPA: TolC family protein [Candidatus Cloacimonadota bacterium]|nr:TolC family protein [Candidatus Cloacimonadota bacterium]HPT72244.1 TolC family protein [Candidatus Cloacimonadota bacterium]
MTTRAILSLIIILCISALFAEVNDIHLRNYLEMGIQNNLDLKIQQDKTNSSHAKKWEAFAGFLPSLDASSRYTELNEGMTINLGDYSIPIQAKKSTQTKFEATQVLFNPAVYFNYKMQSHMTKSDDQAYRTKLIQTQYNILDGYYNCLKASSLVNMRKTSLELAKENYYVTTKLYEVEKVPQTDVLRAQVGMMSSEQDIRDAENQYKLASNYFNSLLNRDMNSEIEMEEQSPDFLNRLDINTVLPPVDSLSDAVTLAMKQRPEIKQVSEGLKSVKSAKTITLSGYLPSIVGVGDYGWQSSSFDYKGDTDYWSITGMLSWNLFSGFGRESRVRQVHYSVKEMERTLESTKHMIELDVRNSYDTYLHDRKQFDVAKQTYQAAQSNYNMVQEQYRNDLAPMVTLMDAKNLLDSSKTNLIVSYFNVLVSKAKYDISLGNEIIK